MSGWNPNGGKRKKGQFHISGNWKRWRASWQRELKPNLLANPTVQKWMNLLRRHPRIAASILWIAVLIGVIVLIPGILVKQSSQESTIPALPSTGSSADALPPDKAAQAGAGAAEGARAFSFPIYLTSEKRIASVTLEQYVRGVVAAEMPIEFEVEALKAQAIAARTYIVRRFYTKDVSNVPVKGAWVTDSVQHQAYLTDKAIAQKWDKDVREANIRKLNQAIEETRGQILTYEREPILAVFFSTSNGYTENSEDYWSEKIPYLRSVESPWEKAISPKYKSTWTFTVKEFARKLGLKSASVTVSAAKGGSSKASSTALAAKILATSEGHRVTKVRIGGKTYTGREVREALGLPSTQFTMQVSGGKVLLTAYGNGHGVGMSQWGAQGMALKGYKAEDILKHYYSGVSIEKFRGPDSIL